MCDAISLEFRSISLEFHIDSILIGRRTRKRMALDFRSSKLYLFFFFSLHYLSVAINYACVCVVGKMHLHTFNIVL